MDLNTKKRIVALIPCLNTSFHIKNVVDDTFKYVDEVVVIDDGSTDDTSNIASKAGAKVIMHPHNKGKGEAMKTSTKETLADIYVFLDGDGQHNPQYIPKLLIPIINGDADMVIGSRHLEDSEIRKPSPMRRLTNFIASVIINLVINKLLPFFRKLKTDRNPTYRITDCTSGYRAITSEAWNMMDLKSSGFEIETEMIFEAAKNQIRINEVPVSCVWYSSSSRLSIIRDGLKTIKLLYQKLKEVKNQSY